MEATIEVEPMSEEDREMMAMLQADAESRERLRRQQAVRVPRFNLLAVSIAFALANAQGIHK